MANVDLTIDTILRGGFREALSMSQTSNWIDKLAFRLQSQQASETWAILGGVPNWKPWRGEVTAEGFDTWNKTITNEAWQNSVTIPQDAWRYDKLGMIQPQVAELAASAINLQWELLTAQIAGGSSTACFDGANFFSTTHAWNSKATNQSNSISKNLNSYPAAIRGSGTAPSAEEAMQVILDGAAQIIGFKNSQGRPAAFSGGQFLVMVPTAVMVPFAAAIAPIQPAYQLTPSLNSLSAAGLGMQFELVANPLLTAADAVYVFRTDSNMKPFALQELEPVREEILGPGSEHAIKSDNYLFTAKWRGAAANFFWHTACKVTMTRS